MIFYSIGPLARIKMSYLPAIHTKVGRVTRDDERFVDFVDFIENLILHFVSIHYYHIYLR